MHSKIESKYRRSCHECMDVDIQSTPEYFLRDEDEDRSLVQSLCSGCSDILYGDKTSLFHKRYEPGNYPMKDMLTKYITKIRGY